MHVEKYNRNAVGHMLKHYERDPKIYKTQKHINPELKQLNYTIGNDELKGMAKYKKILETPGLKVMNRADVNTMIDVVLTLPKAEYFPQERYEEFFEVGYQFLLDKFCSGKEDYLIGCYIHADESKNQTQTHNQEQEKTQNFATGQLHAHFCFASVIATGKGLRMNASKIVTRSMLRTLHKEASDYFYNHFGFDVGIINGATKEGNLTVPQLREQTKKYNELLKTNSELQSENEQLKLELAESMHNLKIWQMEEGITPNFNKAKENR